VEYRLKDGKNLVSEQQLKTLEAELNAALAIFSAKLEPVSTATDEFIQPLDTESSLELLQNLESLLEMGSSECLTLTGRLRLIPNNDELKARLIKQIEDFDFGQAVFTLAELRKKFE
jgi:hypothetical protein